MKSLTQRARHQQRTVVFTPLQASFPLEARRKSAPFMLQALNSGEILPEEKGPCNVGQPP